jgi:hypothetical protein
VGVRDDELDTGQAARDERPEELAPERLGLGLADVEAEDLPATRLMDGVSDDDALRHDAAAVPDLLDLGVKEEIREAALQGALAEGLDLLVEQRADA